MLQIENITPEFLSIIRLPDISGRKLNYLIVVPVIAEDGVSAYDLPLGIALVSSALKASGRSVFTLNLNYKNEPYELLHRTIINNKIDVVMTGGYSAEFWKIKKIVDVAKMLNSITVVGGVIITSDPATSMEAFESVDYGIVGEGEITVNELAYALEHDRDPCELDGIVCRREGKWIVRDNYPAVPDLDVLPFPDYEGFEFRQTFNRDMTLKNFGSGEAIKLIAKEKKIPEDAKIAVIATSRSCPNRCTFCSHPCGHWYRRMSLDKIFEQIDYVLGLYEINTLFFADELTFTDEVTCLEFCHRIKPYNLTWRALVRADLVTEKMLLAMKQSGNAYAVVGIESADNNILRSMQKNVTIEQIENLLQKAKKNDVYIKGSMIFGDTEETMETVWKSLDWWRMYAKQKSGGTTPQEWDIFPRMIATYPGTHLYKEAIKRGLIKDPVKYLKEWLPYVNNSKLSNVDFWQLAKLIHTLMWGGKLKDVSMYLNSDLTIDLCGYCPHCNAVMPSNNNDSVLSFKTEQCPSCSRDVIVNVIQHCNFNQLTCNVEKFIHGKKTAIWAASVHNYLWLLYYIPVLRSENVLFVNKNDIVNPNDGEIVEMLAEKRVYRPDIIDYENIEIIISPNAIDVYYDIKRNVDKQYKGTKQISHISQLMFDS